MSLKVEKNYKSLFLLGKASKKITELQVEEYDIGKSLLKFLYDKSIPIASSCRGAGSCGLCYFNENKLTCQSKLEDYLGKTIQIDYL